MEAMSDNGTQPNLLFKKRTCPSEFDDHPNEKNVTASSGVSSSTSLLTCAISSNRNTTDSQSSLHNFFYKRPKKRSTSAQEVSYYFKTLPQPKASSSSKPPELAQLTLNFGQKGSRLTLCSECGMQYLLSSTEDRKLHDKYHQEYTHFPYVSVKGEKILLQTSAYKIICIDKDAPASLQGKAGLICEFVNRKMNAVPTEWSCFTHSLFLYVTRNYVTGILLVQLEVSRVFECSHLSEYHPDQPLVLSDPVLGIDRIWVAQPRHGIATLLVRTAQREYQRETLAFSQPSEAGWKFALALTKQSTIYIYL